MADPVLEVVSRILAEIQAGQGLSLSAVARMFPGHHGGDSVNPSSVFRWVGRGHPTPGGARVKLEAVRVGGRWLTSGPAVARFVAALTDATCPDPEAGPPAPRTPTTRRKAAERAAEQLRKMGA